uniref:Uncharacterized protein n=1 Tax=Sander lucioperca TaxID=283035 RepID=A0A8C9ZU06_SANLU
MSDREIFKAEIVFIKDSAEGGAGNTVQPGTKLQSENTPNHVAAGTASMETAVDKHRGISQRQSHDTSGLAEVSSGFFANIAPVSEDRMSPTNSADLFPTPASSRESILSEDLDREKSWSAVQLSSLTSPVSFSRTVSPCSSVRSGIFSPTVVQIKRHFLAPGSSLVHTPCFTSCESLSSSVCPQSPPPPPRHRPPLTRLSLLTAILRKGRLPVLSPALQRPYTPCWPVSPVTLSFCNACSAASSVASIPLEFSSRFPSSPNRSVTAPPPVQSNELSRTCPQTQEKRCSSSVPRWEKVTSPPTVKSTLQRVPLPLFCSNFNYVSPLKHTRIDCATSKKLQHPHVSISKSHELKTINTDIYLKGPADNNLKKVISPSPEDINKLETSVAQKWSPLPNSSLSSLHSLSQQLRSPSVSSPRLQPSQSRSPGVTIFCDTASPPVQNTTERCESERSCPDSKTSAGFHRTHCLSPSHYTPMAFPGWPSPTNSPTPTPSPAPPIRDFSPSPSLSMRSTPSPRPGSGISDCSDRESKKRKVAALLAICIFLNTLLLVCTAHFTQLSVNINYFLQMCSPAELRQQSDDLYAVIDEILTFHSFLLYFQQNNSSLTKSFGRETKYVSKSKITKPGVIRPMTAIPRLTVEDEEEFHPNPFRQFVAKNPTDNKKISYSFVMPVTSLVKQT